MLSSTTTHSLSVPVLDGIQALNFNVASNTLKARRNQSIRLQKKAGGGGYLEVLSY